MSNELQSYLQVELVNNQPKTRVISKDQFNQLSQKNTIITSEEDWRIVKQFYQDIELPGSDFCTFPELNTLFSYLLPLLVEVDGNNLPTKNMIVITTPLEEKIRRKNI